MLGADPVWKHFVNGGSFDDFVASYPAFAYHDKVPEAIRLHLDDVHALLIHSYFRYRLLDIAHARALQVIEMALRVRHIELGSPEIRHGKRANSEMEPSLRELLNWAERDGLLEDADDRPSWRKWDKQRTDVIRYLRNYAIHADASTLHGVSIVGLLYRVVDFVNELYQDPRLRKVRHEYERTPQNLFSQIAANGAFLEIDNSRQIVFHAEVLRAVQVEEDWNIYLGFLKIFHPKPDEWGGHVLPEPILMKLRNYEVKEGMVSFGTVDGKRVRLYAIRDETNGEQFRTFKSNFDEHPVLLAAAIRRLAE